MTPQPHPPAVGQGDSMLDQIKTPVGQNDALADDPAPGNPASNAPDGALARDTRTGETLPDENQK
jgi:hypothetical protein